MAEAARLLVVPKPAQHGHVLWILAGVRLSIGVLGPLEIKSGGQRLTPGGHRQERLLALLVVNANQSMTTEQVIDALWEDEPPSTARRQVHNAVARLRRELGAARAAVITDGRSYRLDVADDQVDSLRFARVVEHARELADHNDRAAAIEALTDALRLWRGAALAGLSGRVFESAAAKLDEQRLAARELLVGQRLEMGDTVGLVAELTELTAEHPARETLVRQLMTVLYREGRQADALRVYERARVRLVDELGVDPGPELRQLHEQILRNDPALVPSRPVQPATVEPRFLPGDIADFTGRAEEVDRLVELVETTADTAVIITALDGMPGIGKTTLAVRVGHLVAANHPDGQLFLDLHGHTPGQKPLTPAIALDLLLRGVGVPPEQIPDGVERRADAWRSWLADRQMLVVLDNALDAAQVRPLVPGTPGVRVVVTSRRRLTMLEGASTFSVDLLPPEDAVELFHRVSDPVRAAREPGHVREVVGLCGCLPLAIRIAASRLRNRPLWTVAYLAELLRDEDTRLAELAAGDRSVGAAFSVSYQHLSVAEQRSFRLLGLLPGGDFDAPVAAAVTGVTVPAARRLLEDLVDANLLSQHTAGRYHFHDLLRQYARTMSEQDSAADEREQAVERLVLHYLDLGRAADAVADPGRSAESVRPVSTTLPQLLTAADASVVVAAEHRNLEPVLHLAHRHALHGQAAQLSAVYGPLLQRQGYLDEAIAGYQAGLLAAQALGDKEAEAALHRSIGLALIPARRLDAALRSLRAGLAIEDELGNAQGAGRVYANIGIVCIRMGRFSEALTNLHHALDLLRECGTRRDKAAVLVNLGVVHIRLGNYAEAISCNEQVLAADLANPYFEATGLLNLGLARSRSGDLRSALRDLTRSHELSTQIGAGEMAARSLYTMAECHRQEQDLSAALDRCRASLVLAREICNRDVENHALVVLGQIHLDLNSAEVAAGCFRDSLRLTEADGDSYNEVLAHEGLARVARVRGDRDAELRHWRTATALAEEACLPVAARIRAAMNELETPV